MKQFPKERVARVNAGKSSDEKRQTFGFQSLFRKWFRISSHYKILLRLTFPLVLFISQALMLHLEGIAVLRTVVSLGFFKATLF